MDDKHPDFNPPPYSEVEQQNSDIADAPPNTEANVRLEGKLPVFSESVMKANQLFKDLRYTEFGIPANPCMESLENCAWKFCKCAHPHRHFWARDIYDHKYAPDGGWGEAFEDVTESCGWLNCANPAQQGHWHTFLPKGMKKRNYPDYFNEPFGYATCQKLVVAVISYSFTKVLKLRFWGREEKFEDFAWKRVITNGDGNAGT